MKSEDTKRIIAEIAKEESLPEWVVEMVVRSQFEGVHKVITSGVPDDPKTFKGVRLNAFCHFAVMPGAFKRYKGRKQYEEEKRRRYDNKQ